MRFDFMCLVLCLTLSSVHSLKYHKHQCQVVEKTVTCANKMLKLIPKFDASNEIENLDMSGNDLDELFKIDFKGLSHLKYLHLNYNSIEYIEDDAFENLPDLEVLDLSNNILEDVPGSFVRSNSKLLMLDLSGNIFNTETPSIISETLEVLDLSFTKISTFTEDNIKDLPNLRVLNINSNNLQRLNSNLFSVLNNFMHVELHYNTWACNCETVKLLDALLDKGITEIKDPISCVSKDKSHVYIYNKTGPISPEIYCQGKSASVSQVKKSSFSPTLQQSTTETIKTKSLNTMEAKVVEHEEITDDMQTLREILANEKLYFQELREEKNLVDHAAILTLKILMFFIFIAGIGMGMLISNVMNRRYLRKYRSRPIIK